jgi:hypothetical protein
MVSLHGLPTIDVACPHSGVIAEVFVLVVEPHQHLVGTRGAHDLAAEVRSVEQTTSGCNDREDGH